MIWVSNQNKNKNERFNPHRHIQWKMRTRCHCLNITTEQCIKHQAIFFSNEYFFFCFYALELCIHHPTLFESNESMLTNINMKIILLVTVSLNKNSLTHSHSYRNHLSTYTTHWKCTHIYIYSEALLYSLRRDTKIMKYSC